MLLLVALASLSACSQPRAAAVGPALAKATLVKVLEHWRQGGTIDELRQGTRPVVVQEAHWSNGQVLQEFNIVDDGRIEDANLFSEVELTLQAPGGGDAVKKTVTYVVGTDPVLTVFRAIL
ncbi:MAG: hypothetical protein ACO1RT_08530 [Planctomycetaceae bacterium]